MTLHCLVLYILSITCIEQFGNKIKLGDDNIPFNEGKMLIQKYVLLV